MKSGRLVFALSLGVFLTAGWLAWRFSVFTEGEMMQGLVGSGVVTVTIACLAVARHHAATSTRVMLLLSFLLLVWQGSRWNFWFRLQTEANRLASYCWEHQSVDGYVFAEGLRSHFAPPTFSDNGKFQFHYFMDTAGISYWYDSKTGWGYYPD